MADDRVREALDEARGNIEEARKGGMDALGVFSESALEFRARLAVGTAERLLAALDRVLALHKPYERMGGQFCETCISATGRRVWRVRWPCAEYRIISAALSGEEPAPKGRAAMTEPPIPHEAIEAVGEVLHGVPGWPPYMARSRDYDDRDALQAADRVADVHNRDVIKRMLDAAAPHIRAAERERCAQLAEKEAAKCDPPGMDTIAGPIAAAELRDFADLIRRQEPVP